MKDIEIYHLVKNFRIAIERALHDNMFRERPFNEFPKNCCGDASYLLAEYLRLNNQKSIYVCGEDYSGQTHAWLVVNDSRVKKPMVTYWDVPDDVKTLYNIYGNHEISKRESVFRYSEDDLSRGIVLDITADQFGGNPVYVDTIQDFHKKFVFQSANDFDGLGNNVRLKKIFEILLDYLD